VPRGNSLAAAGLLAVTVALWGGAFRATAVGAEHASSLTLSALRAGPAMLILLLTLPLVRSRLPPRRQWPWAALTGLLMVTVATEALPLAVTRAGAGTTAVLVNTSPLFVALATVTLLRQRLSWVATAGLVVGFGGVVMITAPQLGESRDAGRLTLGMGLALVLSVGWAAGILIIKALTERDPQLDMLGFTAAQYAVGAPILVVAALANGFGGTDWSDADLWGAVAWLAIGTSAIASFTFLWALKRLSAERVAAWQFVVPVIAVLVEIVRGSVPGAIVLGGMALAVAGVAVVNVAPRMSVDSRPLRGRSSHGSIRGARKEEADLAAVRPGVAIPIDKGGMQT
jgi:drug/metabolite transporter (DMT)-like permease